MKIIRVPKVFGVIKVSSFTSTEEITVIEVAAACGMRTMSHTNERKAIFVAGSNSINFLSEAELLYKALGVEMPETKGKTVIA